MHFWVLRTSSPKHVVFKWKDSNSNTNNFRFEFCEQNFKLLIFLYEIKEKYVNTLQKNREIGGCAYFYPTFIFTSKLCKLTNTNSSFNEVNITMKEVELFGLLLFQITSICQIIITTLFNIMNEITLMNKME